MGELQPFWRAVGITGYLLIAGNMTFWSWLSFRARSRILRSEVALFFTGAIWVMMLLLSVAGPGEMREQFVYAARASAVACGLAFTTHSILTVRNRIPLNSTESSNMQETYTKADVQRRIDLLLKALQGERNEARREQMLWQIRVLEDQLDTLAGKPQGGSTGT